MLFFKRKNIKFLIFVGIISLLQGCAAITKTAETPDHKMIYGIDCSGAFTSIKGCQKKAQRLCPKGYTILSYAAPAVLDEDHTVMAEIVKQTESANFRKGLIVQCK